MVATTFSSDTPNLVTDIVRQKGVAGNWLWWAFVLTGVATVFFFARMWRGSGVMTDLDSTFATRKGRRAVRDSAPCTWACSSTASSWLR